MKIIPFAFALLLSFSLFAEAGEPLAVKKAEQTLVKEIAFRNAAVNDVIDYLQAVSREMDPKGVGLNIVYVPKNVPVAAPRPANAGGNDFFPDFGAPEPNIVPAVKDRRVTITLRRVSLKDALDNICMVANLEWKVRKNVIVISEPGVVDKQDLKTVFYPVMDPVALNRQLQQMRAGQGVDPVNPWADPFAPQANDPFAQPDPFGR